jgi:hypothetical protein
VAARKEDKGVGDVIGETIFKAVKPIYQEGERQRRAPSRTPRRTFYKPEPRMPMKHIVFQKLPEAIRNAGYGPSVRDLYYAVRPLVYAHYDWPEGKILNYQYFANTLVVEYERVRGSITGLWRDPRGHLHEAHPRYALPLRDPYGKLAEEPKRSSLALGTREVDTYRFPPHLFDKILYVEKEGEWPKLLEANIPERYDMAVVSSKGYATEAVRDLLRKAGRGEKYQIFVFHDADIDGYEIVRTLRYATWRMPHHSVEIIDLGLTVQGALDLGLDSEPYYRKGGVPRQLARRLTDVERQYFSGSHGERFELNAILPIEARIEYVEEKLKENGVRPKLIPPDEALKKSAKELYRDKHAAWVDEVIAELLSLGALKEELADKFEKDIGLEENARAYIKEAFEKDDKLSWRKALSKRLEEVLRKEKSEELKRAVHRRVVEALDEEEAGEEQ